MSRPGFNLLVTRHECLRAWTAGHQTALTVCCTTVLAVYTYGLLGPTRDHGITRRHPTTFAVFSPVKWVRRLLEKFTTSVRGSFHTPSGTVPEGRSTNGERPSKWTSLFALDITRTACGRPFWGTDGIRYRPRCKSNIWFQPYLIS